MRRFLSLLAVVVCLAIPVAAPAADEPRSNPDIVATIQSQIDAFLADDFATAFTFASPGIKGMFRTPERFGEMVRSGYPMVWRPAEVRYLELRDHPPGGKVQRVMIIDQAGALHLLDYLMIETGAGWQIAGVQILRGAALGA